LPIAPTHLSPIDLAIVAAYLIAITLFGLRFSRRRLPDR
jgi:Na+/proline symporter